MRPLLVALAAVLILTLVLAQTAAAHDGINWRTNYYRVHHGRDRLWTNDNLNHLARIRARQIVTHWGHDLSWMNETSCVFGGENIAMRRPALDHDRAVWFVRAWIESPLHEDNILGRRWKRQGSAIYVSPDGAMWGVQIFCDPRG